MAPTVEESSQILVEDPPMHVRNVVSGASTYADQIVLPDYVRAIDTESRCFIEGCQGRERNRISLSIRKVMLEKHNYYIPQNNRLCDFHKHVDSVQFISGALDNYLNVFNAAHIQDMLSLKSSNHMFIDFDDLDDLDDGIVHFWTGLNKDQFNNLFNEVTPFSNIKKGRTALGVYLMKLRTGDSNDRIATMLKIPRSSLEVLMGQARDILTEFFVPHHLGFHHLNRQQVLNKSLLIPKGLFGNFEGQERPLAIFDGTYTYVQKSSNYSYKKKTYSLHKYTNLVKPFMIVCTDGHIIDVLGPYPAITSDADIIKCEIQKPNSELKEFFRPGDGFILDRGFRDALPILNDCGYRTFVPGTLQAGETQMSTLAANKSRAVTICRWVVEVVNGRFKRDYKLLRQDYFNVSSKHLMKDFEVAAALMNRFHPPIRDRPDAVEILNIINEKMYVNNALADIVQQSNLNRRRANFTRIDAQSNITDFPQLSFSELILISLGTYQIKQARSYYGEHVRANGRFEIEVCREVDSNLLRELSSTNNLYLVRGRIQSRHVSGKIYFIYILVDSSLTSKEAIIQYCCNCIVGRRTVGCCAHVMVVIWYLSWARYQNTITPPAPFLDNILIEYENEDE